MSYTTIYNVPKTGGIRESKTFKNSWLSAFNVWGEMGEHYLGLRARDLISGPQIQRVWDLCKDLNIPVSDRIVMMTTFDNVMVKRENFARLIEAIEDWCKRFDPGTLRAQSHHLQELIHDESCFAVCWTQTSVSGDSWWINEGEDGRMYDVSKDSDHWFLFDDIHIKGEIK